MAHLTEFQRIELQALFRARQTQEEMAKILGCSQSTISRELKRNASALRERYTATAAQRRSEERRINACKWKSRWYSDEELLWHVLNELKDGKSPDQIAGRMKQQGWKNRVSHQSIYSYIERDKERGGTLFKSLRYQGRKHKWRGFSKETRIPNRKGIEERPEAVTKKERLGDWESDLVVSSKDGKGAVATFVERVCMYFRAVLIESRTGEEMVRASAVALGGLPEQARLTMTHDNGKEIVKHEEITERLKTVVYCARPYRSCDRGLNEFMNRELRRFFPKGTDFSKVTQEELDWVVNWLNNCPRRSLSYRTPKEVFEEKLQNMHFTV